VADSFFVLPVEFSVEVKIDCEKIVVKKNSKNDNNAKRLNKSAAII
jgi:hypothetical protein